MASTRPRGRRAALRPTPARPQTGLAVGTGAGADTMLSRPLTLPGVTVEGGLYAVAVLFSLLLRFWRLGDMPLSPAETRTALAAMDVARGAQLPSEAGAVLGFGQALVFAIAGATDPLARAVPALVGALAPLTMVWARPLIGRGPAATAAVLLTFSPLLLDRARALESGAIAATICLALGWAIFDYARTRRSARLHAAAVLLALALTAGTGAVSALLALLVVGVSALTEASRRRALPPDVDAAIAAIAPSNGHGAAEVPAAELIYPPGRDLVLRAAALFAGTLLVVATGALTNIGGVGAGLFAPIGAWLSGPLARGMLPLWTAPLTLVAYEPLALVLGLVGAAQAMRGSRALDRFLVLWAGLGLVAALFAPERSADLLASALAPATVLAAVVVCRLAEAVLAGAIVDYLVSLLVLAWGFSLVLLGFGHTSQADPIGVRYVGAFLSPIVGRASAEPTARALLMVLPLVLLAGGVGYLFNRTRPAHRAAIGAAAATILLGLSVHASWNLAYQAVGNPAELPRAVQTSVDVRNLADDVDSVRQVLTINRKDKELVVAESERNPLAWYLRARDSRFDQSPPSTAAMLVLPADAKPPTGRFAGQRYQVGVAAPLRFDNPSQLWRWLVYRESPVPLQIDEAVLYIRAQ